MEDVRAWQSRPLSAAYTILYFDALFVKSRQEGPVKYLALGINLEGEKEHKVPVPYFFLCVLCESVCVGGSFINI